MEKTIFQKICDKEIPANIVYEDDQVLAFRDTSPQAPTHILMVPRKPIPRVNEAQAEDKMLLGHLLLKAAEVARGLGLGENGFRLVINNGQDGGESVPHLHCHILLMRRGRFHQLGGHHEDRLRLLQLFLLHR